MAARARTPQPKPVRVPLATAEEVSAYLKTPEKTLANWRSQGRGPTWRKVGREIRYDWADVDEWLAAQPGRTPRNESAAGAA